MTRDRVDELASRLFAAAREEQPHAPLQRRVVDAMRDAEARAPAPRRAAALRWRVGFGVALAAAALAAGVWLLLPRPRAIIDIAPEAVHGVAGRSAQAAASARALQQVKSNEDVPAPPASAPPVRSVGRAARRTPEKATLADELAALQSARDALESGDTRKALRELEHYQTRWKGRQLDAEASLLRIEALSSAGQTERAAAEARRFVEQNPNSPLVDRARGFVGKISDGEENDDEGKEPMP